MGFPGNVTAVVTYKLTDDNAIDITYSGTADKPTVLSMTNHAYFNPARARPTPTAASISSAACKA